MKRCTYCGKEYRDDATICTYDAFPLESTSGPAAARKSLLEACPNCGHEVLFTSNQVCPSCGKPKSGSLIRDTSPAVSSSPPPLPVVSRASVPRATSSEFSGDQFQYTPSADTAGQDFRALLDLATPDIYQRNAFRLLEVHVESTDRDLARRKQVMEVAARNKLPVPSGPCRIFPRTPAPDDHEIRECNHAIQDAERRLAHEFFWFWPLAVGQGGSDDCLRQLHMGDIDGPRNAWRDREKSQEESPAAKHNLAVFYHYSALEAERRFLNPSLLALPEGASVAANGQEAEEASYAGSADAEHYWAEATKYWNMVAVEQSCWSRVVARIRAMDDRSLTTGTARRMEKRLPVALALITARLAVRFHQTGKAHHARRQVTRLRASSFPAEAVGEALRIAVEPTRSTIKTLCEAAKKDAEADPEKADIVTERLLEQTAELLALLDLLLPEDNPARTAEHDQIALSALACAISFANKTENWKRSLQLIARVAPLSASTAARERIEHNSKIIQGNFEGACCFFCKQETSKDDAGIEVKMHGDVRTEWVPEGTRTTWRHIAIKVPRCSACKKLHEEVENANVGMGCGGVLAAAFVIIACILASNQEWGWFWATMLGAGGAMWWCIWGINNKPSLGKVLPHASHTEYPRVKELLAQGWTWGERPGTQ